MAAGQDTAQHQIAVAHLDACFDPGLIIDPYHHAGLVTQILIVVLEVNLHREITGDLHPEQVSAIPQEIVMGLSPEITGGIGHDTQLTVLDAPLFRLVEPFTIMKHEISFLANLHHGGIGTLRIAGAWSELQQSGGAQRSRHRAQRNLQNHHRGADDFIGS